MGAALVTAWILAATPDATPNRPAVEPTVPVGRWELVRTIRCTLLISKPMCVGQESTGSRISFQGTMLVLEKWTPTDWREAGRHPFRSDPDRSPPHVEFTRDGGPVLGVYSFSGDHLRICFNEHGEKGRRPSSVFPIRPGETLYEYRLVRPSQTAPREP
jgi:uncharacterized protein (TIGR03067 family)